MKRFSTTVVGISLLFSIAACGSSSKSGAGTYMWPDNTFAGDADPAAYDNGFTFRKQQTDRRNAKPWQFYYKNCESTGQESYYSRTSYTCNGPYY